MLEARQRLIDLATRPLAGNQAASDLAQGELMDRLAHARPADGDDLLDNMTRRLEARTARPAWQSALGFFGALTVAGMILFPVLRAAWQEMKELNPLYHHFIPVPRDDNDKWEQWLTAGLDADQRRFLILNTNGISRETQADWILKARKSPPADPAEFEELILALGSNFLESSVVAGHGESIDPGNGIWEFYAAQQLGGQCLTQSARPGHASILNQHGYEKTWRLLEQAVARPRLESRVEERTASRLSRLRPVVDLRSMVNHRHFASRQRRPSAASSLVLIWAARAEELADGGELHALSQWIKTWEDFTIRQLGSGDASFPDTELMRQVLQVTQSLGRQASTSGMTVEAARMHRWYKETRNILLSRTPALGPRRYAMTVSGSRQDFIADEAEFEPGRRAEFALADRYFALMAACGFVVFPFLAALEAWRRPVEIRGMALGLSTLFRPVDFAWLAGLGLALPLAWHVLITRFTPLACRDFALTEWDMIPSLAQAGGSVLFATCMLLQTARWRMAKRGGVLALRPQLLWPGWCAAAVAAAFVPSLGVVQYLTKWQEEFLFLGSTAAGIPVLWLLWRGGAIAFGPRSGSLGGVVTCRLLFPAFLAAATLLITLIPLLKNEERHWVARDTVGGTDPAGSGLGRLEARTQAELRQQLLEAMK